MVFLHERAVCGLVAGNRCGNEPGVLCAGIEFTLAESIAFRMEEVSECYVRMKSLLLSSLKIELK